MIHLHPGGKKPRSSQYSSTDRQYRNSFSVSDCTESIRKQNARFILIYRGQETKEVTARIWKIFEIVLGHVRRHGM